jgi:hypothetical protein
LQLARSTCTLDRQRRYSVSDPRNLRNPFSIPVKLMS